MSDPVSSVSTTVSRPQPVGVFPLPAGYLLVPDGDGHDEARQALVDGRRPETMPAGLAFYRLALDGDTDGAVAALGEGVVDRVNRLALDPSPELFASLVADPEVVADEALRTWVATVGYIVGLSSEPPTIDGTGGTGGTGGGGGAGGAGGELAAMVGAAHATQALERGDRASAVDHLEAASQAAHTISPVLAGQIMGQLANIQLDEGGVQRAAVTFQAALDALAGTDLAVSRAELHVAAGAMYQEMSEAAPRLMQQAIDHYHQAMALVDATTAPETFAVANANLGLAYLTMPMNEASDQLRMGVAVQSMREALNYFTPESHLERWSSTQLNLANALVYLPSAHQAENITEAVILYEGVLAHRDRNRDPLGRARVLANQGNALAHLGRFADAKARLHESRAIFEEYEEDEAVRSVRGVLDEIARHEVLASDAPAAGDGEAPDTGDVGQ